MNLILDRISSWSIEGHISANSHERNIAGLTFVVRFRTIKNYSLPVVYSPTGEIAVKFLLDFPPSLFRDWRHFNEEFEEIFLEDGDAIRRSEVAQLSPDALLDVAPERSNRILMAPRIAVLVRCHITDHAPAIELANQLQEAGGWDVFFLTDETNGPVATGGHAKITTSLDMCAEMGLRRDNETAGFHRYGDHQMYCALMQRPDYDFYLGIELDVATADGSPAYWSELSDALRDSRFAGLDFLGTYLRRSDYGIHDTQRLSKAKDHLEAAAQGGVLLAYFPYRRRYKSVFAIAGFSRRALMKLYEARLAERIAFPSTRAPVMCEYFVPSVLMESGLFRCAGINALVRGSIAPATFNADAGIPAGYTHLAPKGGRLLHPVSDVPIFLRKALRDARKFPASIAKLRHWLSIIESSGNCPDDLLWCYKELQKLEEIAELPSMMADPA